MKNKKNPIFQAIFLPETIRYGKSKSSHDDQHEKNKENVHLRFLIFEKSPQRYLQNMLRDFQKSRNYGKSKLSHDDQHGKMKKMYISDF